MKSLIIVNQTDCIGCRTCEVACVVAHSSEQELNARFFLPRLKVQRLDSVSAPVMCHQCENAPCVRACPVHALTMGEQVVQARRPLYWLPEVCQCVSVWHDHRSDIAGKYTPTDCEM
ncbi:hypothetical protein OM268_00925 [Escherichia albertii]|nr:hypothetical protein [Escherichia albertii]